jgi:fatty-acyl-CoA synthase
VAPVEVEVILNQHPSVSQSYVVGVPDERWGEIGCAWVVEVPGESVNEDELIEFCRSRLAKFKVPRHILFADAADLPVTATGKVQKFKLVDQAQARIG